MVDVVARKMKGMSLESTNDEWILILPVVPDMCNAIANGEVRLAFVPDALPEAVEGRAMLLMEIPAEEGLSAGADLPDEVPKAPPGASIVGFGTFGAQAKYSDAEVAAIVPLLAGGGERTGIDLTLQGLSPMPQVPPSMKRVQDLQLFAARKSSLISRPPPPISYTLEPVEGEARAMKFRAFFRHVGEGSVDPGVCAHPISTRGGSFNLELLEDGSICTELISPRPRETASAIAVKLMARFDDPNPPGIDACVLM